MPRVSNTRVAPGISTARSRTVLVDIEFTIAPPNVCDTLRKPATEANVEPVELRAVNSPFSERAMRNQGEPPDQQVGKLSQMTGGSCEIFPELLDQSIGRSSLFASNLKTAIGTS